MPVTFDLPSSVEEHLRHSVPNLDAAAKEIVLVTLYRQDKLTLHEFATALGVSRDEANGILKAHQVTEDLLTVEEFEAQRATLQRLFPSS